MKKVLLIRHAKSSWDEPELSDFDRPLNKRGKRNAPEMADRLLERNVRVDQIISSDALRAKTTAQLLSSALGHSPNDITFSHKLYLTGTDAYLRLIHQLPDTFTSVALVGHNPDLTLLANQLGGLDIDNVPTLGMVYLEFPEIHLWSDVRQGQGSLRWFDFPKKPFVGAD